ncbi:SMI1/KNR4 family protein [Bacillus halotolerans]|uniref:SMI1/KNR4 family protein n=1 Tax=Bacillus halotolerans TaxID=260554 RepID=A0ABY7HX16_9BACI|nr:SMI1/KNR4 family protein [Bacillus halotolerans]MDG0767194.1 SMI1/KNR4 family protein [Bacillus halotolerans]UUI82621.1 SMI1/KNR4 family protein [Bacillus halotolerans]WAT19550.1 SMI1/KNR4 family protein [Bacillus halotolerans]
MNYHEIEEFIKENAEDDDFTGGISEEKIREIQNRLNVKLPESYKWFLNKYGSGGIYGVNILGHGKASARVVTVTEEYRIHYDLSDGIVVIEYVDEFSYCLDTNKMENGECPVIVWANEAGHGDTVADNFLQFLMKELEEAKENWEEDEDWDD